MKAQYYSQRQTESLAICANDRFKRAALLFDRFYFRPNWFKYHPSITKEMTFFFPEVETAYKDELAYWVAQIREYTDQEKDPPEEVVLRFGSSGQSLSLGLTTLAHHNKGIPVTPFYSSQDEFGRDYPSGSVVVYQAILNSIPTVVEHNLSWQQVTEFRTDHQSAGNYRALRRWLVDLGNIKSVAEVEDVIGKRIDDYTWAIRKHGMETAVGSLSVLLATPVATQIAGGASAAALIGGPVWSVLSAVGIMVAHVAVHVAKRSIDLKAITREQYAEVAIIAELNKEQPN